MLTCLTLNLKGLTLSPGHCTQSTSHDVQGKRGEEQVKIHRQTKLYLCDHGTVLISLLSELQQASFNM